jgi:hypothetical protein
MHGQKNIKLFIVAFPWQNSTVLYVLLLLTWLKDTDGTHCCVFKEQFQYFWLVTGTYSWRVHRERIVAFLGESAIMLRYTTLPMLLYEAFDIMMPDVWLFSLPVTAWHHHLYLKNLWTLCWLSALLCPALTKLSSSMNAEKHHSVVLYYDAASLCNRGAGGGAVGWDTAL